MPLSHYKTHRLKRHKVSFPHYRYILLYSTCKRHGHLQNIAKTLVRASREWLPQCASQGSVTSMPKIALQCCPVSFISTETKIVLITTSMRFAAGCLPYEKCNFNIILRECTDMFLGKKRTFQPIRRDSERIGSLC